MKIFKVMPLFAALIILSACETAPKGGSGNGGGGSQGPEVIVKPGDNLDESGNIKPDAGSTTTQEFLEALGKGFRNSDLTPLSIKTNNGTYSYVADEEGGVEVIATLDSLKSSTHAIFRIELPLDDEGLVTGTQYIGIAILDGKAFWQFGWVNYYESDHPGNDAPAAQMKAFYEKVYAKGNIDWAKREQLVAALPPDPSKLSAFVSKVNSSGFKYLKFNPSSSSTLEPFSLKSDGSFEVVNGPDRTESYKPFHIENDNTLWYAAESRLRKTKLEEFRFGTSQGSSFDIIAAKPNPALVDAFVAKVNAAALVDSGNTLFNLAADGSFSEGSTIHIFYIPNDSTALYSVNGEYGLRGKKFGHIDYDHDNNGQTERPMTYLTAMQKSDATDPAALDALKAALAGTYTPLIINNPSGVGEAPTTNDGTPFTINADGSFTDATLKIRGRDSTITAATLDSARSASEGRYTATVDGTAGNFIGFEIIDGMLYATSPSGSDINSISWSFITPVAKK